MASGTPPRRVRSSCGARTPQHHGGAVDGLRRETAGAGDIPADPAGHDRAGKSGCCTNCLITLSIMRGLTKMGRPHHLACAAPGLVNEAVRRLLSGSKRPVALGMRHGITWGAKRPCECRWPATAIQCPVDEDGVERDAKPWAWRKRPMIVVAAGAKGAGEYRAQDRGCSRLV